jgi:hypothetical protein
VNEWAQLAQDLANAALRIADAVERIAQRLDSATVLAFDESSREDEQAGG